jgi:polysaccharide biosynthesis protein PslG
MKRLTAAVTALVMVVALLGVAARPAASQDSGVTYYTVQPGDNLFRIAQKFGVTADAIARANGITNPNILFVGQRLIIPVNPNATAQATGAATSAATASVEAPTATTAPPTVEPTVATPNPTSAATAAPTAGAIPATYTVQPGDNLYRIALKFNTTMQAIMDLNGLANPNVIFVGQVLKIPGGSAANNATPVPGATPGATLAPATPEATPSNTASNVGFAFGVALIQGTQDATKLSDAVKDLGVTWVRLPVVWSQLETAKGNIDFASLDGLIDPLASSGVKILLTASSAPDWARNTTTESGPPTDFNDYANFVGALANHYKGRVQAYEVWNEPNIRREWSGRPLSAASYVEMLRLAYAAIKRADSAALVVSAGLSPTGYNDGVNAISDRTYLRQAYAAGLAQYSDAIGAHPNGWANPPDSTCCNPSPGVSGWFNDRTFYFRDTLKDYRDIMTQNGDPGTYIWVTQFGWGSSDGVAPDPNAIDPNFGFVKFTTQAQQAQYVTRGFELGRSFSYVGPMFLFNLNGCPAVGNRPESPDFTACYFSLLTANGDPRPAYDAVKTARK